MSNLIETRVRDVVCRLFLDGNTAFPLDANMSLIESGICDSMGLVTLATAIEKEFPGVRIQDQDITHEAMGSLEAITQLLRARGVDE